MALCSKKFVESAVYRKVISGKFTGERNLQELACLNQNSVLLYCVTPSECIVTVCRFELDCDISDIVCFSNEEDDVDFLGVTTVTHNFLIAKFNNQQQKFEITSNLSFAQQNGPEVCTKFADIQKIGFSIQVLGKKNKKYYFAITAYMSRFYILSYENGQLNLCKAHSLLGKIISQIIPRWNMSRFLEFDILTIELIGINQTTLEVVCIQYDENNPGIITSKVVVSIPSNKSLDQTCLENIPIGICSFQDKQFEFSYFILTSSQLFQCKLNGTSQTISTLINKFNNIDSLEFVSAPIMLQQSEQYLFVIFNNGKFIKLDKFYEQEQEQFENKQLINSQQSFCVQSDEVITTMPYDSQCSKWITITSRAIILTQINNTEVLHLNEIPLFSQIISSAIDTSRNREIISIIKSEKIFLRKVVKGIEVCDFIFIAEKMLPKGVQQIFYLTSVDDKQFYILSTKESSYILSIKQNQTFTISTLSSFLPELKENSSVLCVQRFGNQIFIITLKQISFLEQSYFDCKGKQQCQSNFLQTECEILQAKAHRCLVIVQTVKNELQAYILKNQKIQQVVFQIECKDSQIIDEFHQQISCFEIFEYCDKLKVFIGYYNNKVAIFEIIIRDKTENIKFIFEKLIKIEAVPHQFAIYENLGSLHILISQRNGILLDKILCLNRQWIDGSEITFKLNKNEAFNIILNDNFCFIQNKSVQYIYYYIGKEIILSQIVYQNMKHQSLTKNVNTFHLVSRELGLIISDSSLFLFKIDYFLMSKHQYIPTKLTINYSEQYKQPKLSILKSITYDIALDIFVIIDYSGVLLLMNCFGKVEMIKLIELKVSQFKQLTSIGNLSLYGLITEQQGGAVICIKKNVLQDIFLSNQRQYNITEPVELTQDIQIEQGQIQLKNISFMKQLNLLFVAGLDVILAFAIQTEANDIQSPDQYLKYKQVGKITMAYKNILYLDTFENLLLVVDKKDSISVFTIQHSSQGFKWKQQQTEYSQRSMKEGRFIDEKSAICIDKFGNFFISQINKRCKSYQKYQLQIDFKETGQIISFNKQSCLHCQEGFYQEIVVCGINGSIFKIQLDNDVFNKYPAYFFNLLQQVVINNTQKFQKNGFFRPIRNIDVKYNLHNIIDISKFSNIAEDQLESIFLDFRNTLPPSYVEKLEFEEFSSIIKQLSKTLL